jgi:hypothetical protein
MSAAIALPSMIRAAIRGFWHGAWRRNETGFVPN